MGHGDLDVIPFEMYRCIERLYAHIVAQQVEQSSA